MATYSDFSSIVQLGAGVGIGLSLFQATVESGLRDLNRRLETEIGAIEGLESARATLRRRKLYSLKLEAVSCQKRVGKTLRKLLIVPVGMALVNVVTLVCFAFQGSTEIENEHAAFALMTTVVAYPAIFGLLKVYALTQTAPVRHSIEGRIKG